MKSEKNVILTKKNNNEDWVGLLNEYGYQWNPSFVQLTTMFILIMKIEDEKYPEEYHEGYIKPWKYFKECLKDIWPQIEKIRWEGNLKNAVLDMIHKRALEIYDKYYDPNNKRKNVLNNN